MSKPTFQDIIRSKSKEKDIDMSFRRGFDQFNDTSSSGSSGGGHGRYTMWLIALGAVVFLVFVLSYFFSGANISINPKQVSVPLDGISFTALKTAPEGLSFEIMTVKASVSKTVPATEQRVDAIKASGKIIIYNNFSSASQPLVATTRFETPDGKIYRIAGDVTVPGQQTKNGETIPGSLEVTVFADQPGENYNIPLSDFTIPGFKGGVKYEKIYARGVTPMFGGSTGPIHVLPATQADQIKIELDNELKEKLIAQALVEIPKGYVMFKEGIYFKHTPSSGDVLSQTAEVSVTQDGSLEVFIFNEEEIVGAIARNIRDYDGLPVLVSNIDSLVFNLKNPNGTDFESFNEITFDFTGVANVVWSIDVDTVRDSLAGQKKKSFDSLISQYPSIEEASVSISPFWKNRISDNINKIKINITD